MSNASVSPVSPGYYPPPPGPRRGGCLGVACVLLLVLLGISVLINVFFLAERAGGPLGAPDRPRRLGQRWVMGAGDAKVALVELEGPIMEEVAPDGFFGVAARPVARIRRELDQAAEDENVKAVIFAVDSPGGTIAASDEIHHLFRRFKEKTRKPVVVHMGGICASGGYYVSAGADVILAGPTTITGSIGVILQTFNFSRGIDRLQFVDPITITAGANKDLLNPFRPINEEHVRIVQNMVDKAYDQFVDIVATGRKLPADEVRKVADGRIYTADEALALRLIDKIGYIEDAVEEAKRLAGAANVTLFRYTRPPSLIGALAGDLDVEAPRLDGPATPLEALIALSTPRVCYLWAPGIGETIGGR